MTKPFYKLNQTELRELLADNPTPEEKAKYEARIVYLKNKYQKKKKPAEDSKAKELEMINKHINTVEEPKKKSRYERYVECGLINPNKVPKVPKEPSIVNNPAVKIDIEEPKDTKEERTPIKLLKQYEAQVNKEETKERYRRKILEEVKEAMPLNDVEPVKKEDDNDMREAIRMLRRYYQRTYGHVGRNAGDIIGEVCKLMEELRSLYD